MQGSRDYGNHPLQEETAAERLRFAWLAVAVFVVLTVPRLLHHEMWRDEAWLWLVVTGSRSVTELFQPLARSGQGYLFPLLCFAARQFSTSPVAMQVLHLILAAGAAFAFARWAPLRRPERALFLLGYFPFYEYAVISRHYVAGVLLLWLAVAAAHSRRSAVALGAALGLLCQTTVYGVILAIAVATGWFLDRWLRRRDAAKLPLAEVVIGLSLAVAGLIAGIVQLVPSPDTSFAPGWRFVWDHAHAAEVLRMPWRAFVPLPRPGLNFWNSNLVDPFRGVQAPLGMATLALAAALLWRRKVALTTFLVGAVGLLTFGYIKYAGTLRHQGHFWLLFVAAIWIGGSQMFARRSWRARTLIALLSVQCIAGAWASWMDLRHPFSNGGATAKLIRTSLLDRYPLLGHREPPAATVALSLGRPLYSPSRGVFAMYPDWSPEQREISDAQLRCAARELTHRKGTDIVMVMNRRLPPWEEMTPAGSATGAIVATENYYLYRMYHSHLVTSAQTASCE